MPSTSTAWPKALREYRKLHNLSQAKLAALLSLPNQPLSLRTVEEWESGRNTPPPYLKHALGWLKMNLLGDNPLL